MIVCRKQATKRVAFNQLCPRSAIVSREKRREAGDKHRSKRKTAKCVGGRKERATSVEDIQFNCPEADIVAVSEKIIASLFIDPPTLFEHPPWDSCQSSSLASVARGRRPDGVLLCCAGPWRHHSGDRQGALSSSSLSLVPYFRHTHTEPCLTRCRVISGPSKS